MRVVGTTAVVVMVTVPAPPTTNPSVPPKMNPNTNIATARAAALTAKNFHMILIKGLYYSVVAKKVKFDVVFLVVGLVAGFGGGAMLRPVTVTETSTTTQPVTTTLTQTIRETLTQT
jgi:hypothetical protein